MRVLVVSLLYPLPTNTARGTFVADQVQSFVNNGHDVSEIDNPDDDLESLLNYLTGGSS